MARGSSAPAPELPPDDVIREILLRLPPHPACFQRASLVCKHWRRLVRDPDFLRGLRARHLHGAQPLLGFFDQDASFAPAGEPPDRATVAHLSSRPSRTRVLGCCHGRVLLCSTLDPLQLLVWDPMTPGPLPVFMGPRSPHLENRFVPLPIRGSFICVHDDDSHDGEDCRSRPFRVVILSFSGNLMFAGMYSSKESRWHLATVQPDVSSIGIQPGVLVEDTMYWLSPNQNRFVEYDIDTNQLRLIQGLPTDPYGPYDYYQGVKAGGGYLGVAAVRGSCFELFALTADSNGTMMWTKCLGAKLDEHLSPPLKAIEVSDEDGNTMLFETADGVFELELQSMEVNKVLQSDVVALSTMIAYRSLYVAGRSGGNDG
ncbi:unnamed protein product [Urochloa decumbens]|uniref:F-box domain-containing protein n=1 Tax=Urochloa decumbens TaxID=240449 RepID=A0ABC8XEP4_9POAL